MTNKARLYSVGAWIAAFTIVVTLAAELLMIAGLASFEWRPLHALLGTQGWAMLVFLNIGLLLLLRIAVSTLRSSHMTVHWPMRIALLLWLGGILWVIEWTFMEAPFTTRVMKRHLQSTSIAMPPDAQSDLERFSLARNLGSPEARSELAAMYERIRMVNPAIHGKHPIGETIDQYSARYDVDPTLLFYLAYVHSFWGEAASGRLPFLEAMTGETLRDVIQTQLPSVFVESPLRRLLVESDILERVAGESLGFKLRYALHKATLDVSAQPYELNLYSDVMLVLREYPQEFDDVLGRDVQDPVRVALRDSFMRLRDGALQPPYEAPYLAPILGASYYDEHRDDLRTFARATYYATTLDFDLATRMAALLVDFQRRVYVDALGEEAWASLPQFQKDAMLVMTRDVYVPNVGRMAYNVYALPEMNCTPVAFVAQQAIRDEALMSGKLETTWRPKDYKNLWGGAATKLRVFSEVWETVHGSPLPGLEPEDTIPRSLDTVQRHYAP